MRRTTKATEAANARYVKAENQETEYLISDLNECSETLADWAKDLIERGQFNAHGIKTILREAARMIDKE